MWSSSRVRKDSHDYTNGTIMTFDTTTSAVGNYNFMFIDQTSYNATSNNNFGSFSLLSARKLEAQYKKALEKVFNQKLYKLGEKSAKYIPETQTVKVDTGYGIKFDTTSQGYHEFNNRIGNRLTCSGLDPGFDLEKWLYYTNDLGISPITSTGTEILPQITYV